MRMRCDDGRWREHLGMEQRIEGTQRVGQVCFGSVRADRRNRQKHVRGRKTPVSGTSHVDFSGVPVSVGSALIATYDAMHARDMDSSRLRYDDRRSERWRAADRKMQRGRRVAGLAAAGLDARLHIRQ